MQVSGDTQQSFENRSQNVYFDLRPSKNGAKIKISKKKLDFFILFYGIRLI